MNYSQLILFFIASILLICRSNVCGILVVRPYDLNVIVGQTAIVPCRTDLPSAVYVRWFHVPTGETNERAVYWSSGVLTSPYQQRHSVYKLNGWMNITITNVTFPDAGQYKCIDNEGQGETGLMNLTVYNTDFACSDNRSSDGVLPADLDCSPAQDFIHMTCSVSYSGNLPPVLQWKRDGNVFMEDFKTSVSYSNTDKIAKATSTLLIRGANRTMNGYRYTCSIITEPLFRSPNLDVSFNDSWTSHPLNVLYLSPAKVDTTVLDIIDQPCPVSTNMKDCIYSWSSQSTHSLDMKSSNGMQNCTTECKIGERATCRLSQSLSVENYRPNNVWSIWVGSVFAVIIVIAVILLIIAAVKRKWCFRTNGDFRDGQETVKLLRTSIKLNVGDHVEISGVATSEKYKIIYIICRKSHSIFRFSSEKPFKRLADIQLSVIDYPNDMNVCTKLSCLYVICTNGKIYRVSMIDNVVVEMDLKIEGQPHTLSVTVDGTLVVSQNRITPDRFHGLDVVAPEILMLTESPASNKFTKVITGLPGEWDGPSEVAHRILLHHAVLLDSGNLLISYGESCSYVCEVNRTTGAFIRSSNPIKFDGSHGHLDVSSEGLVYLTRNEGIIKLNSNLEEIGAEEEFDQLKKEEPTRLCCFGKNSVLIGTTHSGAHIIF